MRDWLSKITLRLKILTISSLGYWIIRIVGKTLRWQVVDWNNLESVYNAGRQAVLAFWHGRIFMASYYFRNRGIVVMTSKNRDGEYIARVIQRLGYGVARGSSTRGSHGATVEALRAMKNGKDIGFTIDGPRGPRYVAKPGAVYMAWKSGNPVVPFNVSVEKKWVMRSWDHFQIPKPFSKAVVMIGSAVYIEPGTDRESLSTFQGRVQQSLDELLERGDKWWSEGLHQ